MAKRDKNGQRREKPWRHKEREKKKRGKEVERIV